MLQSTRLQRVRHDLATGQANNLSGQLRGLGVHWPLSLSNDNMMLRLWSHLERSYFALICPPGSLHRLIVQKMGRGLPGNGLLPEVGVFSSWEKQPQVREGSGEGGVGWEMSFQAHTPLHEASPHWDSW